MQLETPNLDSPGGGPDDAPPSPWDRRDLAVLSAILLAAAALRLWTLDRWSLWLDEAFTLHYTAIDRAKDVPGAYWDMSFNYTPLNYWLVGFFVGQWGTAAWIARLGPCIAGVLSIGVLYVAVRRHADRLCATLAAGFLSLSAWHLFWSQNARHYALMLLFATVAAFAGYEALSARRWRWGFAALLAFAAATLSHASAAPLAAALGCYALWELYPVVRRWPRQWQMGLGLALVVLGAFGAWQFGGIFLHHLRTRPDRGIVRYVGSVVYYAELPLLCAALGGVALLWRSNRRMAVFLGTYAGVPIAGIGVAAIFTYANAMYVFYVLPALCALAAHAVAALLRERGAARVGALMVLATVLGFQAHETLAYVLYRNGNRARWRETAEYLLAAGAQNAHVASTGAPVLAYYFDYPPEHFLIPGDRLTWLGPYSMPDVMARTDEQWLAVNLDLVALYDGDGVFRAWMQQRATLVAEFPGWSNFKDRTLRVYHVHAQ